MEVVGKLKTINEEQTFGDKGFRKRDCVVTTDEQYPQMILVEFVQDKCDMLDQYNVGDDVKISINLRGREWINPEGVAKYFNSVQGWRVEKMDAVTQQDLPPAEQTHQAEVIGATEPDDLPF